MHPPFRDRHNGFFGTVAGMLGLTVIAGGTAQASESFRLWYDRPAEKWNEALPIGNGRLGAMVFGKPDRERIQVNEDTVWVGSPHDYSHPGAAQYLPEIRHLLFEGKQAEATALAAEHFMSIPLRQMPYQPCCDLYLEFEAGTEAASYRRELDLRSALAVTAYRVGGVSFTRTAFASYPDQVIVVRIVGHKPGSVACAASLTTPHTRHEIRAAGDRIVLSGKPANYFNAATHERLPSVIRFEAQALVRSEGGRAVADGSAVRVTGADAVTLLLTAATNYRAFGDVSGDPSARCNEILEKAAALSYGTPAQPGAYQYNSRVLDGKRMEV